MPYRVLDASIAAAAPAVTLGAPIVGGPYPLSEIREDLIAELANRTDLDDPAVLNKYINWAQTQIAGMLDLPQLRSSIAYETVADQALYLLPDGVAWIRAAAVQDTSSFYGGRKLTMIDDETYRRLPNTVDEPEHYMHYGQMLVLYPDPRTVRTVAIDVQVRPQPLVADTDSPILPPELHEAILLGARSRGERVAQLPQESQASWNMMLSIIRPLKDNEVEGRADMQAHLQPAQTTRDLYRSGARNGYLRR